MGLLGSDSGNDGVSLFSDINVTPMVDVMLVLLIIFMVTAPLMIETIGVELPQGQGAQSQDDLAPLTITIDGEEKITIAGQQFSKDELEDFLKDSPRIKNKEPIYIEADKNIRHGMLMSVMSLAHVAGASKINIMMETP